MNVVLKNLVRLECWVFIDDVIIFTNTAEEHSLLLENLLHLFDVTDLSLHWGKCVFD